jgi:hypothetical protein
MEDWAVSEASFYRKIPLGLSSSARGMRDADGETGAAHAPDRPVASAILSNGIGPWARNAFGPPGSDHRFHRPCRGVAQPGRAPGSGPGGRRFKSSRPDQFPSSTNSRIYCEATVGIASRQSCRGKPGARVSAPTLSHGTRKGRAPSNFPFDQNPRWLGFF